jgi:hypothetical protein
MFLMIFTDRAFTPPVVFTVISEALYYDTKSTLVSLFSRIFSKSWGFALPTSIAEST